MATSSMVMIRRAELGDVPAITDIYNEAILTTVATFDTEPKSVADREQWFRAHGDRHPILVAVLDGKVVGWASLTEWSDRRAYDGTAEASFYVHSAFLHQGIGRKLLEAIIEEARRVKLHTLLGRVAEGSEESMHLSFAAGFVLVGTMKEVGRKFGRLLDVHILQLMLD
jgi:L-amino acid N-acyltransferase YncA